MADLSALLPDFDPKQYLGKSKYTTSEPPRIAAIKEIASFGLKPPSVIPSVGEVFRFPDGTDKAGKRSGWAVYYEFIAGDSLVAVCVFGSFKGEPERVVWSNRNTSYLSSGEMSEFNARIEAARIIAERDRQASQELAAQECVELFERLPKASKTAYTERKKIKVFGDVRAQGDALVVPVLCNGAITSLQYIAPDGDKRFHPCGRIKGGYALLSGTENHTTYITEGYATGCSIAEATNCNVYVCFNAGNLYEFCAWFKQHASGKVVIAADDDYKSANNTGITKAKQAGEAFGFGVIAPVFSGERGTDFNDLHAIEGLNVARAQLLGSKAPKKTRKEIIEKDLVVPDGVLGDLYRFYMATSGNYQPKFALQTALAIVSAICGRYYVTDCDNCTSMYFINVGRSAAGKEHCKTVVEHVMDACNMGERIAGDGFTSSAAVISLLMQRPVCMTVTDEFGRYLEAASKEANTGQREANTTLMEAYGRLSGVLRAKSYSMMHMTPEQIEATKDRLVRHPALTFVGLTTPTTFFANVNMGAVWDGFLNRFVISFSDAPRELRKRTNMMEVPSCITDWAKRIKAHISATNSIEIAKEAPKKTVVFFSDEAYAAQQKFEQEMINLQNELEKNAMEALAGRANENSMRIALCAALSRDPETRVITEQDVEWATSYMRSVTSRVVQEITKNMHGSTHEADKVEMLNFIRQYPEGVTFAQMQKTKPVSRHSRKYLQDLMTTLVEACLVDQETVKTGGRPTTSYRAI